MQLRKGLKSMGWYTYCNHHFFFAKYWNHHFVLKWGPYFYGIRPTDVTLNVINQRGSQSTDQQLLSCGMIRDLDVVLANPFKT